MIIKDIHKKFSNELSRAEIAKLSKQEFQNYEDSLKVYRDLQNSLDTAKAEGKAEGKIEGKIEIAKTLKSKGFTTVEIIEFTGLSQSEIENL